MQILNETNDNNKLCYGSKPLGLLAIYTQRLGGERKLYSTFHFGFIVVSTVSMVDIKHVFPHYLYREYLL